MGGLSEASAVATNTDGIEAIDGQGTPVVEAVFTADGKRVGRLQRGLNIVRMSNGTIRKVLVR
jgi:hypothetical protein